MTNNYRSKDYICKKRNAGEWKEELKNGLNFEIPVNGMTEDVEQFRLLIGKE